jgi:predicted alpha/beta superfamily hydrolase
MQKTIHNAVNVEVIDEEFYMPQLDRHRRIWVYKPTGYFQTDKRYPVVYMHDGQNLFDEAIAFGEEWGVDDTLNSMLAECIIVGIDNSEHRMTEYNFNDHVEFGAGEGRRYIEFIADTLKPVIDLNFRTKPDRYHTQIAGSSMGGLISLYGAMYYPNTFGGAGVFSPSLWLVPDAKDQLKLVAESNKKYPQRFYFYGGAKEGENMVGHIITIAEMLKKHPMYEVDVEVDPEGEHHEYHWRNKFADYYNWLAAGVMPPEE